MVSLPLEDLPPLTSPQQHNNSSHHGNTGHQGDAHQQGNTNYQGNTHHPGNTPHPGTTHHSDCNHRGEEVGCSPTELDHLCGDHPPPPDATSIGSCHDLETRTATTRRGSNVDRLSLNKSVRSRAHSLSRQKQPQAFTRHEALPPPGGCFFTTIDSAQNVVYSSWAQHRALVKRVVLSLLLIAYCVYLGFAIDYSVSGAAALITLTILSLLYISYTTVLNKPCLACQSLTLKIATRLRSGRPGLILKW